MEPLLRKELKTINEIVVAKDSIIRFQRIEIDELHELNRKKEILIEKSAQDLMLSREKTNEMRKQRNYTATAAGFLLTILILL